MRARVCVAWRRLSRTSKLVMVGLLLLTLVALLLYVLPWKVHLSARTMPEFKWRLCRSFPGAPKFPGKPPQCSRNAAGDLVCEYTPTDIAIVVPLVPKQIDLLERGLKLWNHPDFFPCAEDGNFRDHIDLVFQITLSFDADPQLKARISQALGMGKATQCFRNVRFLSMNLDKAQDQYDMNLFSPGPSTMFHLLPAMEEEMVNVYTHFFLMEPDVRPLRRGWADEVMLQVITEPVEFWQKGSVGYYDVHEDHHINGNALYRLGDHDFNCFLQAELANEYPNSFDQSIFKASLRPENRDHIHRFIRSTFIMNSNWNYYLNGFTKDYPHTFLVHGKTACGRIDNKYKDFLEGRQPIVTSTP